MQTLMSKYPVTNPKNNQAITISAFSRKNMESTDVADFTAR